MFIEQTFNFSHLIMRFLLLLILLYIKNKQYIFLAIKKLETLNKLNIIFLLTIAFTDCAYIG